MTQNPLGIPRPHMTHWARTLSPKAIIIGGIADIVATNIALVPVAVFVFANDPSSLDPGHDATQTLVTALDQSPTLFTIALLLGSACSVFGGWVAAKLAKRAFLLNGAFTAYGCLLLSLYSLFAAPATLPLWQHAALLLVTPALGALGGAVFQRQFTVAAPVAPALTTEGSAPASRGHRALFIANRVLLGATALLAALFALAIAFAPAEDDTASIIRVFVLLTLAAMLCYLVAGRALKSGRRSHWVWHSAAGVFTFIPAVVLAAGLWIALRAG